MSTPVSRPSGFYLMRNGQSHGWFSTRTEAERHAAACNMRGGAPTRVVPDSQVQA